MEEMKLHKEGSTKSAEELKDEYNNILNKYTYNTLALEHSCSTQNCIKKLRPYLIPELVCSNRECTEQILKIIHSSHDESTVCAPFLPWWES